jgi:hypothetical protein
MTKRPTTMLETLTDVQGVLIAAAIIYAAKELRRVSNQAERISAAVESLDSRVSDLERLLLNDRVREPLRRARDDGRASEGGARFPRRS